MDWRVSIDIAAHMAQVKLHHRRTLEYLAQAMCSQLQADPSGTDMAEQLKPGANISNVAVVLKWLQRRFPADRAFDCYPWPSIEEFADEFQELLQKRRGSPTREEKPVFRPGTDAGRSRRNRISRERLSIAVCRELNVSPLDHSLAPYFGADHHTSNHRLVAQWLSDQGFEENTAMAEQLTALRAELLRRLPPHLHVVV